MLPQFGRQLLELFLGGWGREGKRGNVCGTVGNIFGIQVRVSVGVRAEQGGTHARKRAGNPKIPEISHAPVSGNGGKGMESAQVGGKGPRKTRTPPTFFV